MDDSTIDFEKSGSEFTLHPRGRLDRSSVSAFWPDSQERIRSAEVRQVTVDLREVSGMDSSGVAYLRSIETFCEGEEIKYQERNIPDAVREFLRYNRQHSKLHLEEEHPPPPPGWIASLGLKVREKGHTLYGTIEFFGHFLIAATGRILNPKEFHVPEILYHLEVTGIGAVPLIASLSFLLGILMVFQEGAKVSSIGSNILVADMVVMAVTREMAPLVVGVAIAGRSGSAFAAEIGAMKVNDELDALTVMNLDVLRLIILPRVFALALAEPVLTMIADLVGIAGGMLTAYVHFGVPIPAFLNEARGALKATDLYSGLVKAVPCGVSTGFIGCLSGLRAQTGSGSVGIQTTGAVVKSIFAVILIETVFSYIFTVYHW